MTQHAVDKLVGMQTDKQEESSSLFSSAERNHDEKQTH